MSELTSHSHDCSLCRKLGDGPDILRHRDQADIISGDCYRRCFGPPGDGRSNSLYDDVAVCLDLGASDD